MKNCPYCAEEILDGAIKCRHCGEFLDGRAREIATDSKEVKVRSSVDDGMRLGIGMFIKLPLMIALFLVAVLVFATAFSNLITGCTERTQHRSTGLTNTPYNNTQLADINNIAQKTGESSTAIKHQIDAVAKDSGSVTRQDLIDGLKDNYKVK